MVVVTAIVLSLLLAVLYLLVLDTDVYCNTTVGHMEMAMAMLQLLH